LNIIADHAHPATYNNNNNNMYRPAVYLFLLRWKSPVLKDGWKYYAFFVLVFNRFQRTIYNILSFIILYAALYTRIVIICILLAAALYTYKILHFADIIMISRMRSMTVSHFFAHAFSEKKPSRRSEIVNYVNIILYSEYVLAFIDTSLNRRRVKS